MERNDRENGSFGDCFTCTGYDHSWNAVQKVETLDQNGVNNMKTLVTNIMLPVAIFHALATANTVERLEHWC